MSGETESYKDFDKPLPAVGVKWPKKQKRPDRDLTPAANGYIIGANEMHDAFMSIIDKMSSCGHETLDEKEVTDLLLRTWNNLHPLSSWPQCLSKAICQRFALPRLSEEEVKHIRAETFCPKCGNKKAFIGITEAKAIIRHIEEKRS